MPNPWQQLDQAGLLDEYMDRSMPPAGDPAALGGLLRGVARGMGNSLRDTVDALRNPRKTIAGAMSLGHSLGSDPKGTSSALVDALRQGAVEGFNDPEKGGQFLAEMLFDPLRGGGSARRGTMVQRMAGDDDTKEILLPEPEGFKVDPALEGTQEINLGGEPITRDQRLAQRSMVEELEKSTLDGTVGVSPFELPNSGASKLDPLSTAAGYKSHIDAQIKGLSFKERAVVKKYLERGYESLTAAEKEFAENMDYPLSFYKVPDAETLALLNALRSAKD